MLKGNENYSNIFYNNNSLDQPIQQMPAPQQPLYQQQQTQLQTNFTRSNNPEAINDLLKQPTFNLQKSNYNHQPLESFIKNNFSGSYLILLSY